MTSLRRGVRLGMAVLGAGTMFAAAPGSAQTGAATGVFTERPQQALSRNLRSLAANPKSVTALMGAGKAALELGDPQAALTFFARAEEQMPRDGRVKMWIASALVQLQQPHAALKFFHDSTDLGVPAAEIARDRGLAHDIAGNPREAQRDYRMALQKGRDDETTRRLALSLAISGEREPALRLLEDQLLVRDRAAERTRALVLALTGDTAGATRAVQTAMPGPQAGAMTPFLARLPRLSPAERALAVHLGVFPRDGGTAPPSTYAANDFANAVTDAGRPDPSQGTLARRSLPAEPASTAPRRRPGPEGGLAPAVRRTTTIRPVAKSGVQDSLAGVRQPSTTRPTVAGSGTRDALAGAGQAPATSRPSASPGFGGNSHWALSRGLDPSPPRRKPETQPSPSQAAPAPTPAPAEARTVQAAPPPPADVPQQAPPAPVVTPASTLPQFQLEPRPESKPAVIRMAAAEPSAPPPQAQPRAEPESQSPRAELQIAAVVPSAPPPQAEAAPAGSRLADLSATIADIGEPERTADRSAQSKPKPAAAESKPKPASLAAKKPKPGEPAEPSRVWVQVAGGAVRSALPREYARLKAKAPKLLGAHSAWTTPLNATNRLLVGPFASAKEAQTFVNQLKAQDLSAFAWTSEVGQKVEKLPAK